MTISSLSFALLLQACLTNPDLYAQRREALQDDDGDGYGEDDCDDQDPARHPGAPESCDGEDDNCNGDIDEGATDRTWYLDADGDGFANPNAPQVSCPPPGPDYHLEGLDCDDADPNIHPNAAESCDGLDNNCNAEVDEEPTVDPTYWYLDADRDGYGDAEESTRACAAPSDRHVAIPGDCNDANNTVYPLAGELCDGIDQDCDGRVDDPPLVDPEAWYPDDDGDGYGDGSSEIASCGMGDGFVQDFSDCDDDRETVNPGATELCNNGLDDNCNGSADGCVWPSEIDMEDYTIIVGVNEDDRFGSAGAIGDLDADGNAELYIAAPAASALDYVGIVAAFEVPLSTVNASYASASSMLTGESQFTELGASVLVQDVNGDRVDDLVLGSVGESTRVSWGGAVYIVYGPHSGSGGIGSFADWTGWGTIVDEAVGTYLSPLGDMTGDGSQDFAIVEPPLFAPDGVPLGGIVYGITNSPRGSTDATSSASFQISSDLDGDSLGSEGQGLQALDMDADGVRDLALGAFRAGDDGEGLTGLFLGPIGASTDFYDADLVWSGIDRNDQFGYALTAGDVNEDGVDDLIVSARTEGSGDTYDGTIYMIYGGATVTPTAGYLSAGDAEHKIRNDGLRVGFWAIHNLGDLNLDGHLDIGVSTTGAAVYEGPFLGGVQLATDYDILLKSPGSEGDAVMQFMANGGDLFGDGGDDLVIGSPGYDGGDSSAYGYGRTFIIPGISW